MLFECVDGVWEHNLENKQTNALSSSKGCLCTGHQGLMFMFLRYQRKPVWFLEKVLDHNQKINN